MGSQPYQTKILPYMLDPAQARNIAKCATARCLSNVFTPGALCEREAVTVDAMSTLADSLLFRMLRRSA
jgi:hypothetical protein